LGGDKKPSERKTVNEKKTALPPKPATPATSVPAGKVQARLSFWQRLRRLWGGK
jgi:hypothetical protein